MNIEDVLPKGWNYYVSENSGYFPVMSPFEYYGHAYGPTPEKCPCCGQHRPSEFSRTAHGHTREETLNDLILILGEKNGTST